MNHRPLHGLDPATTEATVMNELSRRGFLFASSGAAAGAFVSVGLAEAGDEPPLNLADDEMRTEDQYRQYDRGSQQENQGEVCNGEWQT